MATGVRENEPDLEAVAGERNPSLNEMRAERESVDSWPMTYPEWIELRMKEHRRVYGTNPAWWRNHRVSGNTASDDPGGVGPEGEILR